MLTLAFEVANTMRRRCHFSEPRTSGPRLRLSARHYERLPDTWRLESDVQRKSDVHPVAESYVP